jgi:biopolymer transport protein ExbD
MGGAAPTPSGKSGKKPLDAAINLVPFIDLLSCCISFLLITAVWTQLSRMDVAQKGQGAAGSQDENTPPQLSLTLFINPDGYIFATSAGDSQDIPKKGEEYDFTKLADVLKQIRQNPAVPADKHDIAVKANDAIIYNKIIQTMDVLIAAGFSDVGLSDNGGAQ